MCDPADPRNFRRVCVGIGTPWTEKLFKFHKKLSIKKNHKLKKKTCSENPLSIEPPAFWSKSKENPLSMQTMYPPSKSHLYHLVLPFCTPEKIPEPVGRNRGPVDHVPGHTTAFGMCQGAATSSFFFGNQWMENWSHQLSWGFLFGGLIHLVVWWILRYFFYSKLTQHSPIQERYQMQKKKLFETRTRLDQSAIQKGGRTLPRQGP